MTVKDRRDHGYAWFTLLSSIVCNTFFAAIVVGPPLFLVNLTEAFDLSTYQAGWIISIHGFLVAITVAVSGFLIDKFSCKTVGFTGSLLGCVTLLLASFSPGVLMFTVTFSFLSGAMTSLTRLPPVVIIQMYFNEKRPLATGISLVGYSIGIFVMLPVIAYCIEYYGWRGAMMLVAGLSLNMCVCMLTFTSVNLPESDKQLDDTSDNKKPLLDCSILTDSTFLLAGFSWALFQFGADMMFKVSTPRAELDIGVDKLTASGITSVMGIGGLVSRVVSSVLANIACVSTLAMYAFSILFGGVVIGVVAFVEDYTVTLIGASVYGVLFGMATTVQTTVLVNLLGVEKISRTQGLVSGITGTVYLITVPYAGWMYDTFSSFTLAYLTAAIIQCAGGLLALVLLLRSRRQAPAKSATPLTNTSHEPISQKSLYSLKLSPLVTGSIHSLTSIT